MTTSSTWQRCTVAAAALAVSAAMAGSALGQDRILCSLRQPNGASCITMQQLPTEPVQGDTGFFTQWSWNLTNQCAHTMQVSWGWQDGQVVESIRLAAQETANAACLAGVNECSGKIRISYRCSTN